MDVAQSLEQGRSLYSDLHRSILNCRAAEPAASGVRPARRRAAAERSALSRGARTLPRRRPWRKGGTRVVPSQSASVGAGAPAGLTALKSPPLASKPSSGSARRHLFEARAGSRCSAGAAGESGERIEPRLDDAPRRATAASCAPIPPTGRRSRGRGGAAAEASAPRRRPRRSFLGRLVYWGFVLGLWGGVAVAGLFAYYASQLPPIDQLAVPKRPPNIAILADDGSLIANRGDTGGAAVRLSELPPYLPKAFVAIEDRRFYSHFGIDPIGIARAVFRDVTGRGGDGGRLDADPAARQEPVPDPGAHAVAQDPGGDPGAVARAQIFQGPDPRTLSQPRLFRLRRLWRRSGGAEIFRQERAPGDAVGGGGAGRADEVADPARAQPQSERRQRARRAGHHRDGRAGPHHRSDGQARARFARPGRARQERRLDQLRRRLRHGHARRHGRRDRRGHRRHHHARPAHAGGGRARADRRTQRQGRQVRRRAGRAGRARPRRRGQGAGRRAQLRRQPIQPRRRRQAPARLDLQAVRLSRRAGEGADPRHGARRRADLGQGLEAGGLFARVFRPGHADQGAGAVAQHGRGAARARRSARRRSRASPTGSASPPTSTPTRRSRSAPRR